MPEQLVSQLMSREVLCAPPDATVSELVALMHEHTYSCIMITEKDRPVGLVTERDVVGVLDEMLKGERHGDLPVSEFMSEPVMTINENHPVFDAVVFCRSRSVRHLPVVDRQGRLTGLLTQSDLASAHLASIEMERARLQDPAANPDELIAVNEHLQALALEDSLLGIGNRRAMEVDLKYTHEAALRYSTPYAVAVCDVDFFKQYNDTYGHRAGDEVLRQLVDFLRSQIRKSDRIYRYGDDELLLLFPSTPLESACDTVERLQQGLSELQIEHSVSPFGVLTLSYGLSAIQPNRRRTLSWKQIFDEADHALYKVKRAGRNGASTFRGRPSKAISGKNGSLYNATAASKL